MPAPVLCRAEAECGRRLAAAAAQHEERVAQLRAQWAADKAAAVETERAAGREQLKDAQQRCVCWGGVGWVAHSGSGL